ncbi:hypothetical protein LINPERHAP2_LOCUS5020 [Linum perenne]
MTSKEKDGRAYKPWTTQLDAALIKAMKDVMENGLIENGKFKPEAYKALEKKLFALFPEVDMKADPNIKSRVKTLKIKFDAVQLLKSQSGYGWNDELKCPDIEDQVYDDFVKIHPECANKNRVPYPTYDDMLLIFGKGRATGSKVKQITDPAPEPSAETNPDAAPKTFVRERSPDEVIRAMEDNFIDDMLNTENAPYTEPAKKRCVEESPSDSNTQAKKKKRQTLDETFAEDITSKLLGRFEPMIDRTIEALGGMLAEEAVVELKERDMLVNELKKLDGLSEDEMFDATLLLLECDNKLRMFYRLDSIDEKKKFIMRMLRRLNA